MISHSSDKAILLFLRTLKDIYGDNLAKNTGKIREYLGMTVDFLFRDEVRINLMQYISKVIVTFPEEIVGKAAKPASDHLFKIIENGQKLNEEQANAFCHMVYQWLFAANRAWRDIQTAVSFLTTCV
jgi:hypothetical protein